MARSRRTSTPRCAAESSPRRRPFSVRARTRIRIDPIAISGIAPASSPHDAFSKLPSR
jgi:hypothetical protein